MESNRTDDLLARVVPSNNLKDRKCHAISIISAGYVMHNIGFQGNHGSRQPNPSYLSGHFGLAKKPCMLQL